ncbi:DinB family protein [Singulisphaera sp. PoT]|uniref:DinB family protein n=1 Tax=Singulisphaera sp. PoT TaxID=3411797 RepID=UPI003BF52F8E
MLERECTLYAFTLRYCRLLIDDVPDVELADQPIEGVTHPAWILGHLTVASSFAVTLLGGTHGYPPSWHQLFWPSSSVLADRRIYPSKVELLAAVEAGYHRTVEAARRATPDLLSRPQPGPFYLEDFPTVGDLVAHLMTTHPSLHLGQLASWRRMKGLPSALGI